MHMATALHRSAADMILWNQRCMDELLLRSSYHVQGPTACCWNQNTKQCEVISDALSEAHTGTSKELGTDTE